MSTLVAAVETCNQCRNLQRSLSTSPSLRLAHSTSTSYIKPATCNALITLSFFVALLTALSLSAIATCGTSHGMTGVYAMLARALGKELATATGLIYFLGIIFLAVLECLGACEELFHIFPSTKAFRVRVRVSQPEPEPEPEP